MTLAHASSQLSGQVVTTTLIPRRMTHAAEIDAIGLLCPLPVLKLAKRMRQLTEGQTVCLRADDPAAVIDVPHYCQESGHKLVSAQDEGHVQIYVIRCTGPKKAG